MNLTSNKFEVDRKQVRNWINHEDTIRQHKPKSFSKRHGKVMYPMLEKELYTKFMEVRTIGERVKRWWFNSKAKLIMQELYPDNVDEFNMSNKWLTGFCRRHDISLRRKTHAAQKTPGELRQSIEEFHTSLIRERKRRTYALKDLANMDQTPLPFVLDDNQTYEMKG